MDPSDFIAKIWSFYHEHGRKDLVWRIHITPYAIVVSEIMLQQTQVPRVAVKFPAFMTRFPTFEALAVAPRVDLLSEWQGMGYNRRALYLQQTAQTIVSNHHGVLPDDPDILVTFPGIGPATARSIIAFAYNKPTVFIETNIRRVYIDAFFPGRDDVSDKEIYPLVEQTVDRENPREWYYALMDYGTHLVKQKGNPNKRSKHYSVQSKFENSDRQIRGKFLRKLITLPHISQDALISLVTDDYERGERILHKMQSEGMVREKDGTYSL